MRLISWNVNGFRAAIRSGFWDWFSPASPDILCLQETRIQDAQLTEEMRQPHGYHTYWHPAERRGYSGVATFCARSPDGLHIGLGQSRFDTEGRVLITEHAGFTLVNAYFQNGRRSLDRVAFKLEFYNSLLSLCQELQRQGKRLVVCGDFDTAHQPIDLARPKQNQKTSGFLPEERQAFRRWIDAGYVDVFRDMHPQAEEYTWWTYRFGTRARNIGWRIDYFLVSEDLISCVQNARILSNVMGSDHCPIELVLKP